MSSARCPDPPIPAPRLARPRVAVVIPCFNTGDLILEAVDSLAGEEPHELVIVDDGSTDPATLSALEALRAAGTTVVRQANSGIGAARNAAVAASRAPYVFALDGDDRLAAGTLAALADLLDADPLAQLAWGDLRRFGDEEFLDRKARILDPWLLTYVNDVHASVMIRRDALTSLGGWSADQVNEDWDLAMSAAERGWRGAYLPRVTVHYRVRAGEGARAAATLERSLPLLRAGHPDLYAARGHNRRGSRAPRLARWTLPLIDRLPGLGDAERHRICDVILRWSDPRRNPAPPGEPERHPALAALARRLPRRA